MSAFGREQFETFIKGLKYPPNPFQLKVLESIAFGSGNLVVSALAGSGKTSLLVMTASLFKAMGESSVGYLAFNVSIKNELNERLPTGYAATNSHSLGMQVCKQVNAKTRVDFNKWRTISREIVSDMGVPSDRQYAASKQLQALCSKVMLSMTDPSDIDRILQIAEHYNIENVTESMAGAVEDAIREARSVFEKTGAINFDEMLYWPVVMNLQPPQHRFFLVDECQDLNVLQQELAFRSIKADGRMIFVGDQRQAIYGFAGADFASFQRIIERTKAEVLPLNTCYRCPTSHLDLARKLVADIEARPDAPAGIIEYATDDQLPKMAKIGSLVMCRLTAPLVSAYFKFIQAQVRAKVMGKDIGAQLISLVDKVAQYEGFTYEKILPYLEKYREHQVMMLQQKEGTEQQIENLNDQIETLSVCALNFTGVKSLDGFKDVLEDLFGDDDKENWKNMVTLCTVHRAKGLEADETFILKPEKMPLVWKDQKPHEYDQELNILYVALTRSKRRMVICGELSGVLGVATQPPAVVAEAVEPPVLYQMPRQDALQLALALGSGEPLPVEALENIKPAVDDRQALEALKVSEPFEPAAPAQPMKPIVITPVVVSQPRRTMTELIESMSVGEIDTMIALLQAAKEERLKVVAS